MLKEMSRPSVGSLWACCKSCTGASSTKCGRRGPRDAHSISTKMATAKKSTRTFFSVLESVTSHDGVYPDLLIAGKTRGHLQKGREARAIFNSGLMAMILEILARVACTTSWTQVCFILWTTQYPMGFKAVLGSNLLHRHPNSGARCPRSPAAMGEPQCARRRWLDVRGAYRYRTLRCNNLLDWERNC